MTAVDTAFYAIAHTYTTQTVYLAGTLSPASLEGTCAYLQNVYEHLPYPGTPEAVTPALAAAYLVRAHACEPARLDAISHAPIYTLDLHWNWEQWCVSDFATGRFAFNRWASPLRAQAVVEATLELTTLPETRRKLRALLDRPIELRHTAPDGRTSCVDHNGAVNMIES